MSNTDKIMSEIFFFHENQSHERYVSNNHAFFSLYMRWYHICTKRIWHSCTAWLMYNNRIHNIISICGCRILTTKSTRIIKNIYYSKLNWITQGIAKIVGLVKIMWKARKHFGMNSTFQPAFTIFLLVPVYELLKYSAYNNI